MIETRDLTGLPLFAGIDATLLARTASRAADVRVGAGEYVVYQNETTAFYVLLEGTLEVVKVSGTHEVVLAERRTPGEYFGEVPLLVGSLTLAALRATSPARLVRIEPQDFRWLFATVPSFAAVMVESMRQRFEGVQEAFAEMPFVEAVVVGRNFDRACHDVRDFLARNHVAFEYFEIDDACVAQIVPDLASYGERCPIVKVIATGKVLVEPSLRDLANAVSLQTAPNLDCYDVVIVGGGPAGLAAAVYGASEGLTTVLIDREAPGGQAGTSSRIENYLGFPTGISGDELATRAFKQATRFGAQIVVTRSVIGIDVGRADHHVVRLDGGDAVCARSIVLAAGVSWRKLAVPDIERFEGAGVYYGAARTEAPATRGKDVYLVGAGNSAGQAAMYFANYARTVTLLVRGESLAASMSDYLIKELATRANVRVETRSEIAAVYGNGHLAAIDVRDRAAATSQRRDTEFVFVFIGADAETAWIPPQIARDARGYVVTGLRISGCDLVDPWPLERDPFHLETSVPGIFAAGDVRADSVKRCASAVGEGSMAIAFAHQHFELEAAERPRTPALA